MRTNINIDKFDSVIRIFQQSGFVVSDEIKHIKLKLIVIYVIQKINIRNIIK